MTRFHGKSSNLHTLLIHWNVSQSFLLLTASAAFGGQKVRQNIMLSNSTFYNLSADIYFVGVSFKTARVRRLLKCFFRGKGHLRRLGVTLRWPSRVITNTIPIDRKLEKETWLISLRDLPVWVLFKKGLCLFWLLISGLRSLPWQHLI